MSSVFTWPIAISLPKCILSVLAGNKSMNLIGRKHLIMRLVALSNNNNQQVKNQNQTHLRLKCWGLVMTLIIVNGYVHNPPHTHLVHSCESWTWKGPKLTPILLHKLQTALWFLFKLYGFKLVVIIWPIPTVTYCTCIFNCHWLSLFLDIKSISQFPKYGHIFGYFCILSWLEWIQTMLLEALIRGYTAFWPIRLWKCLHCSIVRMKERVFEQGRFVVGIQICVNK